MSDSSQTINKTPGAKSVLVSNYFWGAIGLILERSFSVSLDFICARLLTLSEFGVYGMISRNLDFLTNLGIGSYGNLVIRNISLLYAPRSVIKTSIVLKIVVDSCLYILPALFFWVALCYGWLPLWSDSTTLEPFCLLGLAALACGQFSSVFGYILRGLHLFKDQAGIRFIELILGVAFGIAMIRWYGANGALCAIAVFGFIRIALAIFTLVGNNRAASRQVPGEISEKRETRPPSTKRDFHDMIPIVTAALMRSGTIARLSTFILNVPVIGPVLAGQCAICYTVQSLSILPIGMLGSAFLPHVSQKAEASLEELWQAIWPEVRAMIGLCSSFGIVCTIALPWIMKYLLGITDQIVLRSAILFLTAGTCRVIYTVATNIFIARRMMFPYFLFNFVHSVMYIVLGVLWAEDYGILGLGLAVVFCHIVGYLIAYLYLAPIMPPAILGDARLEIIVFSAATGILMASANIQQFWWRFTLQMVLLVAHTWYIRKILFRILQVMWSFRYRSRKAG